MTKTCLVPIAPGSEEIEAVVIIDTLRRAKIDVTVASVTGTKEIAASRGVNLVADVLISECKGKTYDMIALPGGMPGAANLHANETLHDLLNAQESQQRWFAAICAAPAVVLAAHGLLEGRKAICYPGFVEKLPEASRAPGAGDKTGAPDVVVSKKCITSRGPATGLPFALTLVAVLAGTETARTVAESMLTEFKVPTVSDHNFA
ncbi:hypothetical protein HK101_010953 [Irineochytrium annulatum]|nr:hypothetical protein HK101_010953 [Irineochytrium annulatum]